MDPAEPTRQPAVLPAVHREQIIAALCQHFSQDHLTLEEFERRLDAAHLAQTAPALAELLQDLPSLSVPDSMATSSATTPAPTEHARELQHFVAIMGGVDRRGRWQPARKTFCYAFMGGASLDFREALLPPGETQVTIIAIMGGAEILVPPGLRVDCDGIAIMGGFDHGEQSGPAEPNAPVLKITGFALMGGVEIVVRRVGETAKDTRLRLREERRRRLK